MGTCTPHGSSSGATSCNVLGRWNNSRNSGGSSVVVMAVAVVVAVPTIESRDCCCHAHGQADAGSHRVEAHSQGSTDDPIRPTDDTPRNRKDHHTRMVVRIQTLAVCVHSTNRTSSTTDHAPTLSTFLNQPRVGVECPFPVHKLRAAVCVTTAAYEAT